MSSNFDILTEEVKSKVIIGAEKVNNIFTNAPVILRIHPLTPHWTFWVWKSNANLSSWVDSLHEQFTFTSIEQFWALQHRIVKPSQLNIGNWFFLFFNFIRPNSFKNLKIVFISIYVLKNFLF